MPTIIDRPPRIQPPLPQEEIEVPSPPDDNQGQSSIFELLLPLAMIAGYVALALGGGGRSIFLIIPMGIAMVGSVFFSIRRMLRDKRELEAQKADYKKNLVEMRYEMMDYHQLQRDFFYYNYPDITNILSIAARRQMSRSGPRIWERRPHDADFGMLRLGVGVRPSTVIYKLSGDGNPNDPLMKEAQRLCEDSLFVDDIPITISLKLQENVLPSPEEDPPEIRNSLGIYYASADVTRSVGKQDFTISNHEREFVYRYTNALLAHFTIFHADADAKLFVIGTEGAKAHGNWSWMEHLPHCREGDEVTNICFEGEQVTSSRGNTVPRLPEFWKEIRKILQTRKRRLGESDANAAELTSPFFLVVVDMMHLQDESDLKDIETEPAVSMIMNEGKTLGAGIIFLTDHPSKIPSECQAVVELERVEKFVDDRKTKYRIAFRYAEVDINTPRFVGIADVLSAQDAMPFARSLSEYKIRLSAAASLPTSIDLLQLNNVADIPGLKYDYNWKLSRDGGENAEWPTVKIGFGAGNEPYSLTFAANASGIHGMVAGTTGSGKSELLITMIVGLAVNYDPSAVNFLLIDYKGGAAFEEFRVLPHCIDVVTNLDASAVGRVFASIKAELDRRGAIIAQSGVKHIVEYRERGMHLERPLPHLFIIIDEFAEMVANSSEYKSQLDSITRLGRAIGVSLVLATQRPAGMITDQMRANMKFKVCLRVETPEDSRELLRSTEAAYLPPGTPGRAYVQIGNDIPELIQVARAGAPYRTSKRMSELPPIIWLEDGDDGLLDDDAEEVEMSKLISERMSDYALQASEVLPQRKSWPDPLPKYLPLDGPLLTDYLGIGDQDFLKKHIAQANGHDLPLNGRVGLWMRQHGDWVQDIWRRPDVALQASVGLIDHPTQAQQLVYKMDLYKSGHLAIFGGGGWGKTTFLRTIITSFAAIHSPLDLHMYILDFGGGGLDMFQELPHVGAVIAADEDERINRLMLILNNLLDERKAEIQSSADDILAYNANPRGGRIFPAILVIIDNFSEIKENYEDLNPLIISLMREGRKMGIYFVATANLPNAIPGKIYNLFGSHVALTLADEAEYSTVVGRGGPKFGEIHGRGLIRVEREVSQDPLEFQVAAPIGLSQMAIQNLEEQHNRVQDDRRPLEEKKLDLLTSEANQLLRDLIEEMKHGVTVAQVPRQRMPRAIDIPDGVDLLQMKNRPDVDQLDIERNWARTRDGAEWPSVEIGVGAGDEPVTLTFSAKASGVHGLIAGTTGSGKSELLLTMIVGLGVNYDPNAVNFLLVDFKGGAAFEEFRAMPHCIDVVTNLDKAAVGRVFASIQAELDRRGAIIARSNTKHIVDYRERGYHKTRQPFPHLFIIIDEFAEMIQDSPEYKAQLDSITRLGRAIGVSLILATQRPANVITDQMKANMKFRICLRVETPEDSRELLRRPDAAYLPNDKPGRAYLQMGNQTPELIQVAQAGAKYRPPAGSRLIQQLGMDTDEDIELSRVVVEYMAQYARHNPDVETQRKAWPDPLPKYLTLNHPVDTFYLAPDEINFLHNLNPQADKRQLTLNETINQWLGGRGQWINEIWSQPDYVLKAAVGLVDHPSAGKQRLVMLNMARGGNVAIFGGIGWGKTTFLRTVVTSFASTHSPHDLHFYIFDFGGRALQQLAELPHVGAVIPADHTERINRLLRTLNNMLEERKAKVQTSGKDFISYNASVPPDQRFPAVMVLINNFDEIKDNMDNILPALTSLIREGRGVGMFFIATGARSTSMPNKVFNLFTTRMSLQQSDPNEYRDILGRRAPIVREIVGRGVIAVDREISKTALAFQVAAPIGLERSEYDRLQEEAEVMAQGDAEDALVSRLGAVMGERLEAWISQIQAGVSTVPHFMPPNSIEFLTEYSYYGDLSPVTPRTYPDAYQERGVKMGIEDRDLSQKIFNLGTTPHFLIVGPPLSGKTTMLQTWIIALAQTYSPEDVGIILIDPRRRLFTDGRTYDFSQLPHVLAVISEEEEIQDFTQRLKYEYESPYADMRAGRDLFIFIDNYDDLSIIGMDKPLRYLGKDVRTYERQGLHVILTKSDSESISSSDNLLKQVWHLYRYGFALQSDDAVMKLDGRLPRASQQADRPAGRGFIVRSGRLQLMQVATLVPQGQQDAVAEVLQQAVQTARQKHLDSPTPYIGTMSGGLALYNEKEIPVRGDVTDQLSFYDMEQAVSVGDYIKAKLTRRKQQFVLQLENLWSEEAEHDPLVFNPIVLAVHRAENKVLLAGNSQTSLYNIAAATNSTGDSDEATKIEKHELKLYPQQTLELEFSAEPGDHLTLLMMVDVTQQWLIDLYPPETEEEGDAGVSSTSAAYDSVDISYDLDDEVSELLGNPNEIVERSERGQNEQKMYYSLLDAHTLHLISDELFSQIPFQFKKGESLQSPADIRAMAQEELQGQIDQDRVLLPDDLPEDLRKAITNVKIEYKQQQKKAT